MKNDVHGWTIMLFDNINGNNFTLSTMPKAANILTSLGSKTISSIAGQNHNFGMVTCVVALQ